MSSLYKKIREDLRVNPFFKGKFIMVFFRLANFLASGSKARLYVGAPFIILYIFVCEWILGVEIHVKTKIGKGLALFHGVGLVVNGFSVIGDYCTLRQGVTLGNKMLPDGTLSGAPVIGNHVEFGAGSAVLGDVIVGDGAKIGAGAIVLKDVPEEATAVGVPAKNILKR